MATEIKPYRAPRTRAAVETAGDLFFSGATALLKPVNKLRYRYAKNAYWHHRERAKSIIQSCPNCNWTAQVHFHVAKIDELCEDHKHLYRYSKIQYD